MFTGFTNQIGSISSWIGSKKPAGQSQDASPQQPEAPSTTEAPPASSPVDSEANGGAAAATPAEGEQPKDTLFSSMKFQMPSWLSKKENKEEDGAKEAKPVTPEAEPKEKPMEEQAAVEGAEGENKEGFTALEDVSTKAIQGARTIGSFFASAVSKAGKTVTEAGAKIKKTVEETAILTEFNKEQEAFIKSKQKGCDGALAPWAGYPDEEALKAEILSLSTDRRNFVRSPPAGVQFDFDYDTYYPIALAILAEDPDLQQMRFDLVPKLIKEELFWRNYFYRVSLIKQSSELSTMAQGRGNRDSANLSRDSSDDEDKTEGADTPDSPMNEFVSDSFQNQTATKDLKDVQEGIKRLGTKKQNEEDWEKELNAELQDYELGSEGSGKTDGPDGDDIEEMLDAEESHGDLK